MIPFDAVTAWSVTHPWPTREQVEQDLLLSHAICAIANDPYLGEELVFRGGTALHKLHLDAAYRYSEDLDYVRSTASGISRLTGSLTQLGQSMGFEVRTRVSQHPKIYWRTTAGTGVPIRLKIEINTHERSPALPPIRKIHHVDSDWWRGQAEVLTFQPVELVATKIRALYQRSKGRDLFDLWLALEHLELMPQDILAAFEPYRPSALTSSRAVANLKTKLADPSFQRDLNPLIREVPSEYDHHLAGNRISNELLSRLTP